jgi:hypothetical protein
VAREYDGAVVIVDVVVRGEARPPAGSPVRVEVRDTARADAEAPLLAEATAEVAPGDSPVLATVEVGPEAALGPPSRPTVFVHVDVDRDGALSAGDLITTASFPLSPAAAGGEGRIEAMVVPI